MTLKARNDHGILVIDACPGTKWMDVESLDGKEWRDPQGYEWELEEGVEVELEEQR